MILKSFGCSFIFGTDLADDGRHLIKPTASNFTWPALLAKQLGYEYRCYARGGSGNLQILEQIMNQVAFGEPSVFVIGWSWIDRFDYYDANWNGRNSLSPWKTILPVDTTDTAENYYRQLHSEYRDKLTSLIYIKSAIDLLNDKKIPFVMTYMDDLLFDSRWNTSLPVRNLQSNIRPYLNDFEGMNFLTWSQSKNFPISPIMHPLEDAHASAADYMLPLLKNKIQAT